MPGRNKYLMSLIKDVRKGAQLLETNPVFEGLQVLRSGGLLTLLNDVTESP